VEGKKKIGPRFAPVRAAQGIRRHQKMNETVDSDRTSDPARRRERGIEAYARIFDVPEKDVPAAMAASVRSLPRRCS
jgi:hypothetical protein